MLDLIDEYRVENGPRPPAEPQRGEWDFAFANRFDFTPDQWNDGEVTDDQIEAQLQVTALTVSAPMGVQ